MMLDGDHRDARRGAGPQTNAEAVSAAMEAHAAPPGHCEVMLRLLCRDDTLRASYVRRRWQGLAG